ncbi:hypothetical protein BpHYR1_036590 [Brachionus plicatilis]|uniref:VPS35 endosomal protein-sorting factor-like n=1 Tax=Brachionus plicatilis TaxID=10195 RepID=A0A3M7T3L3_BRAPC|nr:hypothetical protein BpHYR1_036590 [Brachionus plicatilis]
MSSSVEKNSLNEFKWVSKGRCYARPKLDLVKVASNQHPLRPLVENVQGKDIKQSDSQSSLIDPLSAASLDPLSKMVAQISIKEKQEKIKENEAKISFEPWSLKKNAILARYTTVEKLSITSSFLNPINGAVNTKTMAQKSMTTMSDKIKNRLEQLDQFDEENMQEMVNLSQQDYIKRIDELNNALLNAWNEDEKVKSLKIVIQCSKLLADTSVIQFYPSKFVLITDILDTFGKLVYERIKSKSTYLAPGSSKPQPLPENFTADIVPASAKETCRNWFFKIASIRELLPRIYVEAAILKCTNFLSDESVSKSINRLISMTSGIGDPLVAAYANCYICRVGISIDTSLREHQLLSLNNLLFVFKQISNEKVKKLITNEKIDLRSYIELYCPAIDWILQSVTYNRNNDYLKEVLNKCIEVSNANRIVNGLLINSMMSSFEPSYICQIAADIVEMIKDSDEQFFPKHLLFRNLAMCLVFNDHEVKNKENKEKNKQDLKLLNDVWKLVTKFEDIGQYMMCAEIWIEFTLKNFTKKEINTLIGDIIKHVQPDRQFENFYPQLQSIVSKILTYVTDYNILFSMDKFMQFLNLFQKDSIKMEVYKSILNGFLKSTEDFNDDIVVMNSIMQICKSMHDYVNALTLDDEKREISNMICSFINRIEMIEKDKIEQYLSFYSDCRASFSNLDSVISLLIHKVNHLAYETLRIVNYNHSRKTGAFVRACVAFSFITIPSLTNPIMKLKLYLESSQTALINQCLSQADAFLKSAISLIPDIQKQIEMQQTALLNQSSLNYDGSNLAKLSSSMSSLSSIEKFLAEYVSNMMTTLLLIPDNPDQGVLYLLTGVVNLVLKNFQWDNKEVKFNILIEILKMAIESNDTLYGSDPKFIKELNKMIESVLDEVLNILNNFAPAKQSSLALELLNRLVAHCDLTSKNTLELAEHLWTLSISNKQITKLHVRFIL